MAALIALGLSGPRSRGNGGPAHGPGRSRAGQPQKAPR
jgi:hypothetical protein